MEHKYQKYVPVVDCHRVPLMPTTWSRAWRWVRQGKATYFYKKGILCVRLNQEPSDRNYQDTGLGLDPGSKFEGYSVKSEHSTYINIQADARTGVKDAVKDRRTYRRNRRYRNTPYRECRPNRHRNEGFIPPSIKARWQWRLKIISILCSILPIRYIAVEDVCAATIKDVNKTDYVKQHNTLFSWVQNGKNWFYSQLEHFVPKHCIYKVAGYDTHGMRVGMRLHKSKNKGENSFWAHCVDAWIIISHVLGCNPRVDNLDYIQIKPIKYSRRQLHVANPAVGGIRKSYGSTLSMDIIRGTLVYHKSSTRAMSHGYTLVGGTSKGKISLHHPTTHNRLATNINPKDCKILSRLGYLVKHFYYMGSNTSKGEYGYIEHFKALYKPRMRDMYHSFTSMHNYYTRPVSIRF